MESWEFLLQKEGDRAWLPLESPDVEILEGYYRVVARSNCPKADIAIRITHQSSDANPLQPQLQQRLTRTNAEGLMVVIPYTRLKPGNWEFCCTVEKQSAAIAPIPPQSLQLLVLPIESEISEPEAVETDPASQADAELESLERAVEELEPPQPTIAQTKEELKPAQPAIAQTKEELKPPQPAIATEKIISFSPTPTQSQRTEAETLSVHNSQPAFPLRLTLEQETFVAQVGQALTLFGRVDIPDTTKSTKSKFSSTPSVQTPVLNHFVSSAQLQIHLRDPQNSRLLLEIRQPLPEQVPPWVFACTIYVPAEFNIRLILGEVAFCNGMEPLVSKAFTIMADVKQILEVVEQDFSEAEHQSQSPINVLPGAKPPVNRSFLDLVETFRKTSGYPSSANQPLPPQITARSTQSGGSHALELPTFDNRNPRSRSRNPKSPTPTPREMLSLGAESKLDAVDDLAKPQTVSTFSELLASGDPAEVLEALSNLIEPSSGVSDRPVAQEDLLTQESQSTQYQTNSPPVAGFQALKLQERFWSRLNSLATDDELSEWLERTLSSTKEQESVPQLEVGQLEEAENSQEPLPETPASVDWEAAEIVVDDEESSSAMLRKQQVTAEELAHQLTPYVLSPNESVPMPVLKIAPGEAIAGRPTQIRVLLPELLPRIYVKLWVYDRQTYIILDGPRWLTEFFPNGLGAVEAIAELEIPPGSMEVEFEAIAVEMQTQRESNKVTVHRRVIPPPAPTLLLE